MPRQNERRDRGAVLLIALAILALLSLFATAFVRLVNFEKRASANYTDAVRARLLAKAGIEHAAVMVRDLADKRHYSKPGDRWEFGFDVDPGVLAGLEMHPDLQTTSAPSFPLDYAKQIKPRGDFTFLGRDLVVSGVVGETYSNGLDVYKLKVIDTASQLNLNHPDAETATRMLANLLFEAAAIQNSGSYMEGGWPLTIGQARKIANHVIANRPVGGFRSKAEIQELVVFEPGATHPAGCKCGQNLDSLGADSRVTEDRWLYAAVPTGTGSGGVRPAIRDMVTVYSWIDEKVIRPWDLNGEGRRGLSLMPRAPINLNTATQPVLVALLADLRCESNYGTFYVGRSTARDIAKAMITQRKTAPFRSWPEFESWLDSANIGAIGEKSSEPARTNSDARGWWWPKSIKDFPEGLVPDPFYRSVSPTWSALTQKQGVKDLIKAQLNPNTMLNKFGQGANHGGSLDTSGFPMPRLADKSDLVHVTTEGCFDAMGVYEITSLGMILLKDQQGALVDKPNEVSVVAAHTIQVVTRIYDVLRLTTQSDFEQHRALMAPGDFIPDTRAWKDLAAYNRNAYQDHPGWPGMVTHPVYSLARKPGEEHHAIKDEYSPANYDGHVTLSNLLGVELVKHDFVAGFARGGIDAFKARAWWEPKDQHPGSGVEIHQNQPSQPFGCMPRRDATGKIVGRDGQPLDMDLTEWLDQDWSTDASDWPEKPVSSELDRLLNVKQPRPVTEGAESGFPDPLDARPGEDATSGAFWDAGSSLWNNGVALGSHRNLVNGKPTVLAFDSDNVNLQVGSSIRFWVQPLADPYLKEEEVLFSFVGSQDGSKRQTGFRVIKRTDGVAGVSVVLQAVPSTSGGCKGSKHTAGAGTHSNPWGINFASGNGELNAQRDVKYRWHHEDGGATGLWKAEATIDVTPRLSDLGERLGPLESQPVDPFNPEWLPNSWHWVVINYGHTGRDKNADLDGDTALPQYDVSIQVDMNPTQPPKGIVVSEAEGTGRIPFKGEKTLSPGYGQIHGHDTTRSVGHGDPVMNFPLGWRVAYQGGGKLNGSPAHGPLGDEYQSPEGNWTYDYYTGSGTKPGVKTPGWVPPDPYNDPSKVTRLTYHYHWYVHFWVTPRTLGDFYHCGVNGSLERSHEKRTFRGAIVYGGRGANYRVTKDVHWPANALSQVVEAEFHDPRTGALVRSFNKEIVLPDGTKKTITIPVGDGRGKKTMTRSGSGWTVRLSGGDFGKDLVPGASGKTGHEWRIDLVMRWEALKKVGACSCCTATEDNPAWGGQWDGAYMRMKNSTLGTAAEDKDMPWPNGCLHDSGEMTINTIPPGNDGDSKCHVPFHSQLSGHRGGYNNANQTGLPAPDTLPAEGVCDDCSGCEACDVDGPMFLGGEPSGKYNYSGGKLAEIEPKTVARAVFDNFVIKNSPFDRTDYVKKSGDPSSFEVEWYEDRFFAGRLAEEYLPQDPSAAASDGYGAVFRRGLLELIGTRARLGSMTWTTYESSDKKLGLEPRVWLLDGVRVGTPPAWRSDNPDVLRADGTQWRADDPGVCETDDDGAPVGMTFNGAVYNGLGDPAADLGPEVMIVGFQLRDMFVGGSEDELNSRWAFSDDGSGEFQNDNPGGLPTPIYESPVLEDVTLNLIRESPEILYAEEGTTE